MFKNVVKEEASERDKLIDPSFSAIPERCINMVHSTGLSSGDQFNDSLEQEVSSDT